MKGGFLKMKFDIRFSIIAFSFIVTNASLLILSSQVKENTKRIKSLEIESFEKKSNKQ